MCPCPLSPPNYQRARRLLNVERNKGISLLHWNLTNFWTFRAISKKEQQQFRRITKNPQRFPSNSNHFQQFPSISTHFEQLQQFPTISDVLQRISHNSLDFLTKLHTIPTISKSLKSWGNNNFTQFQQFRTIWNNFKECKEFQQFKQSTLKIVVSDNDFEQQTECTARWCIEIPRIPNKNLPFTSQTI